MDFLQTVNGAAKSTNIQSEVFSIGKSHENRDINVIRVRISYDPVSNVSVTT